MEWLDMLLFWAVLAALPVFALAAPGMVSDIRDVWRWLFRKRRKNARDV
jgi:hypothetical protein